ncbi:NUDIX hydrolase [Pseudonocardia acaciae]|uniref:NUDIX hydrolase n=1 Tax=Pseudonocardia acaciae TaxID=551276 RepID=UPI001FDEC661|nr:CoA pyrophosphatase [Pseudonocardia acaciae]
MSVECTEDGSPTLVPEAAPGWLVPLLRASATLPEQPEPPDDGHRPAAVLVLFGHTDEHGPDLLLQERAAGLRNHAGQVSFPGGGMEPGDGDAVATALREAAEETGLDPAGVDPLALLPELYITPSGFHVTPVLAHWRDPVAVAPVDPAETAAVVRVPVADLAEPSNRFLVRHPSGWVGPAFEVAGLVVWGFTGGLVDALLRMGGWERDWPEGRIRDLDEAWASARRGSRS